MSYFCVSYATGDQGLADRFCRDLSKYGFSYVCINERTPGERRDELFSGAALLLVLTSPAADRVGCCATDLRRAAGSGMPCVCITLSPNELDERYGGAEDAVLVVPYPAGETDTPDERAAALFIHRLFIRCLSCYADCFSPIRCVDDAYGRAVTHAYKARLGDAAAQYALGQAYAEGIGLPVLESEAAYWIDQAARGQHPDALIRMGELRLDGEGVERDPAEALRLFSAAARLGDPRGQFARGICCLYGYGLMKDPEMALRYFRTAASKGYLPAYYRLGLLYRDGLGTEANRRLAIRYLYIAAVGMAQDPPYLYGRCMAPLGDQKKKKKRFVCVSMRFMRQKTLDRLLAARRSADERMASAASNLTEGTPRFCATYVKVKRWYYPEDPWLAMASEPRENARKSDYSHQAWNPALAESALGRLLELGSEKDGIRPSPRAALMWYRRSVMHGHVGAVFRLGDAYRSGNGVPRDPFQGVKLFRRAAELGSRRGQFALGVCCERGEGIAYDPAEAVKWYELSAKGGYAPAQNNLGGCYEYGVGVQEDLLTAVEWYTRASAEGEPNATCRLGLCYENGRGVTQSEEKAFRLYEDAARHKHPYALYRLGLFYDRGVTVDVQVAYAAHLYERAALGGVGDAAYAMALCCGEGRGVRKNPQESLDWLKTAAEQGSVQGCYALGLAYYEGRSVVQNKQAAAKAFARGVALYEAMNPRIREESDRLVPVDGMTLTDAAGKSLYMMGYGCVEDDDDRLRALTYFEKAAAMGCGEAMTAVGDMFAHGLVDHGDAEANRRSALDAYESAAEKDQAEALLSLAICYEQMAREALARDEIGESQSAREAAFRCLSRAARLGHMFALTGVAGCYWFGYGVERNRNRAYDHLLTLNGCEKDGDRSARFARGNIPAALWLGDLYLAALAPSATVSNKAQCIVEACEAYQHAASMPYSDDENKKHLLSVRRLSRRTFEEKAKAEAYYRLAVMGMMHLRGKSTERDIYEPLGAAVLSGHEGALEDLARLYLYEKHVNGDNAAHRGAESPRKKRFGKKSFKTQASPEPADPLKCLWDFGAAYYGKLLLVPEPFKLSDPLLKDDREALPELLRTPLTEVQKAEALNRLGDRYFYGHGVAENRSSAVACYRRAAAVSFKRGEPVSGGVVWAQYSLGYCLLHGVGAHRDPREAVRLLTLAAKYHGEASLCLAKCHLDGTGVDRVDHLEALKYYRRALKFGLAEAEEPIRLLEATIREEEAARV